MQTSLVFLVLVAVLLCTDMPIQAVEIIAHRGASADAPENTLSAFKLGFKQKADAIELDMHLTKDGRIVAMHDKYTARTTGVTNEISRMTFAELRKLNAGNWGSWRGKGFKDKVPSLEEVLRLVPRGKRVFIEIKCGAEALPELKRVLERSGKKPNQTAIIGFDYETVRRAKALFPNREVCFLAGLDKKDRSRPTVDELVQKAIGAKLDGLDLEAGFPIDAEFVRKVHAAGLKLYTWTVDDAAVARRQAVAGVDGITTNRPRWLREQLQGAPLQ